MDDILGRFRNLIVLAAILFAQIMGLAVQVKRPAQAGETRLLRLWAVGAITPFENVVVHTQNFFRDTWHNYLYLRGVRRENRELRAEIDHMKLEQVRLREDADMAHRLQVLLAFKEQHIDKTVAAQVIGSSGSDQSRLLFLDKGSNDGIARDMAVITPSGIVGKIVQVFPDSAQVLPINDQLSGVGVALKSSRLQGTLKGNPDGTVTVQYIMSDEKVDPGEEIITTGGDRIFPRGLPVGTVVSAEPGKDLFFNIKVKPSADLNRLDEVLVVTKVSERPPDTKDLGPIRASDILAQRLPGVPDKSQVDAAGNAVQPATGAGAAGGSSTTNPATGTTAARPTGPAAARPGATGGAVQPSPRPGTAAGTQNSPATRPAANAAKPATPGSISPSAGTTTPGTSPGARSTPKPVRKPPVTPAPQPDGAQPATTQPPTPPAGESPQQQ